MFGLFKKRRPTVIDAAVRAIYGENPPTKSADLERAITIAHEDLLAELVPIHDVEQLAGKLLSGPMPYSTHDLAVATALSFYKNAQFLGALKDIQIGARLRVLNWMKGGKVAPGVLTIFEDTLYQFYKPSAEAQSLTSPILSSTPPPLPEPEPEYESDLVDALRFTEASKQWFETSAEIGRLKAACKANGIEAEHAGAVGAVMQVDLCILKLMKVGDYEKMLEQENRLGEATKHLVSAIEVLSEAADARGQDVSATLNIVVSLTEVLKARGML